MIKHKAQQSSATRWRRSTLAVAVGLCVASSAIYAQQSAGSITGRANKGDVVVVESRTVGISRQVKVENDGAFQVPQLPAGTYSVTITRANGTKETTQVNVQSGEGSVALFGSTLQRVVVTGTGAPKGLDVQSTESTQILNKAQIDRIPVVRDVTAVTLLAPGAP